MELFSIRIRRTFQLVSTSFVDVSRFTVNHQMKNLTKLLLMSYADCSLLLLSLTFSYKLLIITRIQIFHYDLLHINDFL